MLTCEDLAPSPSDLSTFVPLLLGTLLSLAVLLRRSCLTRDHSPLLEQSWSAISSKQQPLCEEAAGASDYTKQDKPSDLWTVRARHSPPPSAKGCSVLARLPGCTFLTAGTQSQR